MQPTGGAPGHGELRCSWRGQRLQPWPGERWVGCKGCPCGGAQARSVAGLGVTARPCSALPALKPRALQQGPRGPNERFFSCSPSLKKNPANQTPPSQAAPVYRTGEAAPPQLLIPSSAAVDVWPVFRYEGHLLNLNAACVGGTAPHGHAPSRSATSRARPVPERQQRSGTPGACCNDSSCAIESTLAALAGRKSPKANLSFVSQKHCGRMRAIALRLLPALRHPAPGCWP